MTTPLENLWDDDKAAGLSEPEQLLYRSNLLGADLRITNYGGGNTSAKVVEKDPLTGEGVEVLWVKGSGGDLRSMNIDGFSTLYMDKLLALKGLYRGLEHEDEMVAYLPLCTFNNNPRAASIDTPLHTYLKARHIDHMHPDAVIAIAAAKDGPELTKRIFGGRIGWLPWQRPGYDLGLQLERVAAENPEIVGVVLGGHGLFTWAETSKDCYLLTLDIIQRATDWLEENNDKPAFGGVRYDAPLDDAQRRKVAASLMPRLRGLITSDQSKVGNFNDSDEILQFVDSKDLGPLAALGTSCPDHFLRTKIFPLVLDFDPAASDLDAEIDKCTATLSEQAAAYREDYARYYERCKHDDSPAMRDANAVVYLAPGVGMFTFAKDKTTARLAGEFYVNAINVMREANGVSEYVGLSEQEAFNIEYWLLEEAKLRRQPPPKSLAGKVAVISGGAGGIGRASTWRLLREGACVMLADIDTEALQTAVTAAQQEFGADVVRGVHCDVTDEQSVANVFAQTSIEFGGVDIVVANAGIASAAAIEDTTLEIWERNMSILATGYFLFGREGYKVLKAQGVGGSVVFVVSKNGLAPSPNASAYCTAKAAEIQLARSIALEGAPLGIRCNIVNPDAVLRGSKIWTGKWREERAAAYGLEQDELEEHYRQRSLLKRSVFPEDIAEAVYFFASGVSDKSTGNILNVDAGYAPSFSR